MLIRNHYFTSRIVLVVGGMWVVWLEDWAPELHIPGHPAPSSLIRTIYRVALEQTRRQARPPSLASLSRDVFVSVSVSIFIWKILKINESWPCKAVPCPPCVDWRRNVAFWIILPHIWKLILKMLKTSSYDKVVNHLETTHKLSSSRESLYWTMENCLKINVSKNAHKILVGCSQI